MTTQKIDFGTAQTDRKADIVFCIDATGSMDPCFSGIKTNLDEFLSGLDSHGAVDWRFKLLAYRDKHDANCGIPWQEFEFTNSATVFLSQLNSIRPNGGGDLPESTLDALFFSIKSQKKIITPCKQGDYFSFLFHDYIDQFIWHTNNLYYLFTIDHRLQLILFQS